MTVQIKRLIIELTHRCPASCGFCFLRSGGRLNRRGEEAPPGLWRELVSSAPAGCDIYLTGGEPLLRTDCLSLVEHTKDKGLSCGINTLGILADKAKSARLNAAGLDYMIFSLHGPERVHDAICGLPGAFRKAASNLSRFASLGNRRTELLVSCTICPENQSSLYTLYRFAAAAGADRVLFEHLQFFDRLEAKGDKPPFSTRKAIALAAQFPAIDTGMIARELALCAAGARNGGPTLCVRPALSGSKLSGWYRRPAQAAPACPPYSDTLVFSPDGKARFCQNYAIFAGNGARSSVNAIANGSLRGKTLSRLESMRAAPAACLRCCQRHKFSVTRGKE